MYRTINFNNRFSAGILKMIKMASYINGKRINKCYWDNWLAIWKEKWKPYLISYTRYILNGPDI